MDIPASFGDHRKTILIVDSDELFRHGLSVRLRHELPQISVEVAGTGKEALWVIEHKTVDLLVTELDMPVMDGFELLTHLRDQHIKMPVLVMTESPLEDVQDALRNLGYYILHRKETNPQQLIERVRDTLTSEVEGSLHGVSIAGFLQLLEAERKNCMLTVIKAERTGQIHVVDGTVIDAHTENLNGLEAAKEIVAWSNVQMFVSQGSRCGKNNIKLGLNDLLLQAFVRRDEMMQAQAAV